VPGTDTGRADGTDLVPLRLVSEHRVGRERLELRAEPFRAVRPDARPRRQVDAHAGVVCARELDRPLRGRVDWRAEERIARDVETVAREPRRVEIPGLKQRRGAAIGRHRALPVRPDDRDDDAVFPGRRPDQLDVPRHELHGQRGTGRVIAAACDAPGVFT